MKLRTLEPKDAPLMLEWMHTPSVVEFLQTDFASMTLEDCKRFIKAAHTDKSSLHMAIVDETDTYMGTASLKNIRDDTAEFAIAVRLEAMGQGYSRYGMNEILRIGREQLHLKCIYWYVAPENRRARRFYEKQGYSPVHEFLNEHPRIRTYILGEYLEKHLAQYIWYTAE